VNETQSKIRRSGRGWRQLCALAALGSFLATGCNDNFPGKPNRADRPVPEDQSLSFELLYRRNCAGCHGVDGRLGPAPPLNDATFLAIIPAAELLRVIHDGRHGTPMPPFARDKGGALTARQVRVLAGGIKQHWQGSAKKPNAAVAVPPDYRLPVVGAGGGPPGDRERGAKLFASACGDCHGKDGKGEARVNDPAFLALISNQALRRIIITGRPDLGMPTFAGGDGRPDGFQPLTSAEIDDLVALLAAWRTGGSAAVVQQAAMPGAGSAAANH
jgi:cytochrome c oxidase cbb3-type subunit III